MQNTDFELSETLSVPARLRIELLVMEALWTAGPLSMREMCEEIQKEDLPSDRILRLTLHQLKSNNAIRKYNGVNQSQRFEAVESRKVVYERLIRSFEDVFPVTRPLLLVTDGPSWPGFTLSSSRLRALIGLQRRINPRRLRSESP